MGDLNHPQFNHLLPHVGQTFLLYLMLRSPNREDLGRREREKFGLQDGVQSEDLGAKVIRNMLVRKTRVERKRLCCSIGQRAAAYSLNHTKVYPWLSAHAIKEGNFFT